MPYRIGLVVLGIFQSLCLVGDYSEQKSEQISKRSHDLSNTI